MKVFSEYLEMSGKLQKKGLYDIKAGDIINVGIEGQRGKHQTKIVKVSASGKLVDASGNMYNRDGSVFRLKNGTKLQYSIPGKDKKVYAQPVLQKEFDTQYKKTKIDFIRKFDWESQDVSIIEEVLEIIKKLTNTEQANRKQISRFK